MKGPWVKLWRELPSDEKLLAVIADHGDKAFRVWIVLITRANDGQITDKRKILAALCDAREKKFNSIISDMADLGMVDISEESIISIPNWVKYQEGKSTPRMRAFRERHVTHDVTPMLRTSPVTQRVEEKRGEEKRRENIRALEVLTPETEPEEAPKPKPETRFRPPTLQEVSAYFSEKKTTIDPAQFLAYYEARGWAKIKNWRACLTTWEGREDAKPKEGALGLREADAWKSEEQDAWRKEIDAKGGR